MALKKAGRKPKGSLVQEIDAAIVLLTRVRLLAIAATNSEKATTSKPKRSKRALSPEGREAIAAAQRKRWAKIKQEKKRAR